MNREGQGLTPQEAEVSAVGELALRTVAADDRGEDTGLLLHALEGYNSPDATAIKQAMHLQMGYRHTFRALRAMKRLGMLGRRKP